MRKKLAFLLLLCTARHAHAISCSVNVTGMAFGNYSPLDNQPSDSVGTVTVACTNLIAIFVNFTVKLSPGVAGGYQPRQLASGTGHLSYNLYTDPLRSTVWGNGSGGTATQSLGALIAIGSGALPLTVYGRIPAKQNVAPGLYSDTIIATVEY